MVLVRRRLVGGERCKREMGAISKPVFSRVSIFSGGQGGDQVTFPRQGPERESSEEPWSWRTAVPENCSVVFGGKGQDAGGIPECPEYNVRFLGQGKAAEKGRKGCGGAGGLKRGAFVD